MALKSIKSMCVFCILTFFLSACQQSPSENVITSKADGSFEVDAVISASENHTPDTIQNVKFSTNFYSTDKSVEINMNIDDVVTNADMPVLEVAPHYLSEYEIERAAKTLFGESEFYEWAHYSDEVLSKEEIQEKLNRWSIFTSQDNVDALYGHHREDTVRIVKLFIEEYNQRLELAPNEPERITAQWKFKKAPYYLFSSSDADAWDCTKEDDMIKATLQANGVPFTFSAGTRNQDDYKANYISAYVESDSPDAIDKIYFRAQMCRTAEPTDEQINTAKETAEKMLVQMGLGEWYIDKCYVDETYYGDSAEYIIYVKAVPLLMNVPALRQNAIYNLTDPDIFASNYQITDVEFQFSANGDLLHFSLNSPIDIVNVINDNVAVLTMDELFEKARMYFEHSTFSQYDSELYFDPNGTEVGCRLDLNHIAYSLARIRVPNTEENYYYVPSLTLYGDVTFFQKSTGDIYFVTQESTLLTINAVDGSIINSTNG